jgi:farnesyl-diphosphate farnesyltransferase
MPVTGPAKGGAMSLRGGRQGSSTVEADLDPGLATGRLDELLARTSRTFALAIPFLPEPTRRQVGIAYLLFRIADTFEDSALWAPERRLEALASFGRLLDEPRAAWAGEEAARWLADPPSRDTGYLELLAETPAVLSALAGFAPEPRRLIAGHTVRTALGMASFVERRRGGLPLQLEDLADLEAYCYAVAGIVGELLTELFLLDRPRLTPISLHLRSHARRFGEGLQLVNILKDAGVDAEEGRNFLPGGCERASLFARAREDLGAASSYVLALEQAAAPAGIVGFTALPVRLAFAALARVERQGAGAKLSRAEVLAIAADLREALRAGRSALPALESPRAIG